MNIVLPFLLVVVGFVLLIKGADYLINGSSSFAKRLKIPEIVIGLTIVAFGTSAPELIVNSIASYQGNCEIVFGNIIGSCSFNIILILGVASVIYPLNVQKNTIKKEIPFSFFTIILVFIFANDSWFMGGENILSRVEGGILLALFVGFLYYAFVISKTHTVESEEIELLSPGKTTAYMLAGLFGLFYGGKLVVDNSITIARVFEVSEKLIALTIVSGGTSLPELVTSAVAAYRKKPDIAVGNVVGSNIFNILLILGVSSVISPVAFNTVFNFDIGVLVLCTLLLFGSMFSFKKYTIDRREGIIYLIIYVAYMAFLIYRK